MITKYELVIVIILSIIQPTGAMYTSLCDNYNSTLLATPQLVVLREQNSQDDRIKSALDDVECWLQKHFNVVESFSVPTKGDAEMMCYKVATVPIRPQQLLVFVGEHSSYAANCSVSIYGTIPNILNIRMVIDGTRESPTRAIELALRNTGGFMAVQSSVRKPSDLSKIRKSMEFLLEINKKSLDYSRLLPFWKPTISVPPATWQMRMAEENRAKLEAKEVSISWVMVVNVLPMLVFGTLVSCYIVIRPRGGLTYTNEEIDFTIQEVDSNTKVNTLFQIPLFPETAPRTAIEPDLRTAIPKEEAELQVDKTPPSQPKSPEEMRLDLVDKGTVSEDTMSLKTGVEVKSQKEK